MSQFDEYEGVVIPTYVINLTSRKDRLEHIKKQFHGKNEFDLNVVEACKHQIGAVGLWQSIIKVIKMAADKDEDVIIICEDDHEFTESYSKKFLLDNLMEAHEQGVNILSGGIGGFKNIVPITPNRFWIDSFWCTQFIVIYKKFFQAILEEPFTDEDTADGKFSEMTSNKMVLYPFISVQKDFGYSDVTKSNDQLNGQITRHFNNANERLSTIMGAYHKYKEMTCNKDLVKLH